jgi:hypothetical protein
VSAQDDFLAVSEDREDAIGTAIAIAFGQALEENIPITIFCCVGDCGRTDATDCPMCERIVVMPDGTTRRDPARH